MTLLAPWQGGKYDATQFKNKCISKRPTYMNLRPSGKMGEDCLYLNIWTPKAVRRFPLHSSLLPPSRALPPISPAYRSSRQCMCMCVRRVQAMKLNSSLPVYVFVHGGGLREGSGSFTFYDGAAFAASNNVVVVTINYRLGPFGFLVPPPLPNQFEGEHRSTSTPVSPNCYSRSAIHLPQL